MNKQRRKSFLENIMRLSYRALRITTKNAAAVVAGLLFRIIHCEVIKAHIGPYPNVEATITRVIFRCTQFTSFFHRLYIDMEGESRLLEAYILRLASVLRATCL